MEASAETVPYTQVLPCKTKVIRVTVFEGETAIRELTIDLSKPKRRDLFNRLIDWAITNSKFVEIQHVDDYRNNL